MFSPTKEPSLILLFIFEQPKNWFIVFEVYETIPIELYRSVRTYDIWKKDAVPKDWSPPNEIEIEKEQQALEEQRRATKETIQEHSKEEFDPTEHF